MRDCWCRRTGQQRGHEPLTLYPLLRLKPPERRLLFGVPATHNTTYCHSAWEQQTTPYGRGPLSTNNWDCLSRFTQSNLSSRDRVTEKRRGAGAVAAHHEKKRRAAIPSVALGGRPAFGRLLSRQGKWLGLSTKQPCYANDDKKMTKLTNAVESLWLKRKRDSR